MLKQFLSIVIPSAVLVLGFATAERAQATTSFCDSKPANKIQNCGFEDGDFTDWTVSGNGNPAFSLGTGVDDLGATAFIDSTAPNTGTYDAWFGTPSEYAQTGSGDQYGPPTSLTQSLTLLKDHFYKLVFYLANDGCSVADPGCPGYYNYFDVLFNNVTVFAEDNVPTTNGAYQKYTFEVATAKSTAASLQFDFSNDSSFFYLDDVVLSNDGATPEPATFLLMLAPLGLLGWKAARRRG